MSHKTFSIFCWTFITVLIFFSASLITNIKTYKHDGVAYTLDDIKMRISQRQLILEMLQEGVRQNGNDEEYQRRLKYAQEYLDSLETIKKQLVK